MGLKYYNRKGETISLVEWATLFQDFDYKQIKSQNVGDYLVSTVWLGLDHSFSFDSTPMIFETMVFPRGSSSEDYCKRYATEEEAIQGHKEAVEIYGLGCKPVNDETCTQFQVEGIE